MEKETQKSGSKLHVIVWVLIVVVVVAIIAVYFWSWFNSQHQTLSNTPVTNSTATTSTATTKATTTATPISTAGWKTQTDYTYGLSFKYPSDWKLTVHQTQPTDNLPEQNPYVVAYVSNQTSNAYLSIGETNINFYTYPTAKATDFNKWFDTYKKKSVSTGSDLVISEATVRDISVGATTGKSMRYVTTKQLEGSAGVYKEVYFVKNSSIWGITFSTPTPDSNSLEDTYNLILSTVAFAN